MKVIDYGSSESARAADKRSLEQTRAGFIGTPAFASPEQFVGSGSSHIDTRSDIYSLGVTLWYLLTGRTPFFASSLEELHDKQTKKLPLEQLKDLHIPARCVELLKWMLAPDPKDRPQSARELLSCARSLLREVYSRSPHATTTTSGCWRSSAFRDRRVRTGWLVLQACSLSCRDGEIDRRPALRKFQSRR